MASRIVQYFADKLRTVKEYPITLTKAVYDENGKRLDNTIDEINRNLNPDYSRYTFTQYISGSLPVITASERVDVLITVNITYKGKPMILFPSVNNVGLAHPIGGGRSMSNETTFANISYSETIRLGEGDVLTFTASVGSLSATSSLSIGLLPYK